MYVRFVVAQRNPQPHGNFTALCQDDFSKGVRGKYSARLKAGSQLVVVEPDVVAVFGNAKAVNRVLRTLLERARWRSGHEIRDAAHRDLLIRYGMPETFLDELGAALDRFEQSLNDKHNGRAAHVGARADLEAVTAEIMLIVRQLDALNRFRFRNDTESLAAWKSARDVAWPAPSVVEETQKPAA